MAYHQRRIDALRFASLFGLLAGLGAANHYLLLGVFAAPLLLIICLRHPTELLQPRQIAAGLAFALLPISTYLYLPIRESFMPALSWGDFSSFGAAIRSILRIDQELPVTAAGPEILRNLQYIGKYLYDSTGPLLGLISLVGLALALIRRRMTLLLIVVPTIATIFITAWAAEYSPYNLDLLGYLMPAFALLSCAAAVGFGYMHRRLSESGHSTPILSRALLPLLVLLIPAILLAGQFHHNYPSCDKSQFRAADRYAESLLSSIPPGGIFVAGEDNSFLPALCMQQTANQR
jgi:uncharacterized membrane protein